MKKKNQAVCPGCSRHCAADVVRCKRGRVYFEKLEEKKRSGHPVKNKEHCGSHGCKWKKLVAKGGALRTLLQTGKDIKKALCHGEITEAQLTARLNAEEWAQLTDLLSRLGAELKLQKKNSGGE